MLARVFAAIDRAPAIEGLPRGVAAADVLDQKVPTKAKPEESKVKATTKSKPTAAKIKKAKTNAKAKPGAKAKAKRPTQ